MATLVALLRGINVSGRNKIPMADLRSLAEQIGASNPRTYIQSGNLVLETASSASELESTLETAISERFDLTIPVIVRSARQWKAFVAKNPVPDADPKRLMLGLAKAKPSAGAVAHLEERARAGEVVHRIGDALWIHFPGGVGTSKLSPAVLDRAAGSSVTMRNLRTVEAITALLGDD